MAKRYLITISDDCVNDIEEIDRMTIDDEGIVWYNYCYADGAFGESLPVGVIEEVKE